MLTAVAGLLFLSGLSALIYQVVWLRNLSLVFGVTVHAASTVLASFMAGLAIGSVFGGRLADRVRRPLGWFGGAELLIGTTALLSVFVLEAVASVYVTRASSLVSGAPLTVLRLACAAAALLVPCTLMGATLPLALRSIASGAAAAQHVSILYFVNTAGAVAGCLLAGFLLIGMLGLRATLTLAAVNSIAVGSMAIMLSRRRGALQPAHSDRGVVESPPSHAVRLSPGARRLVLAVFAISGFTSLALEIIWFRTLVLYYHATSYAFTTMLATVLCGMAVGSLIAGPILKRQPPTLWWFGLLHAAAGILAVAGSRVLAHLYGPGSASSGLAAGAAVTILPSTIMLGLAFPTGIRLWLASSDRAGRDVGIVYALNLAGAIAGAVVAGFVLLSEFGTARSLAVLAGTGVAAGLVVLLADLRRSPRVVLTVGVLSIALYVSQTTRIPDPFRTALTRRYPDAGQVFMRDEGVQTTVSVHMRERGGRQLFLDGLHQASDGGDVVTLHRRIGHLPVLLHGGPKRALVIGLGGGATAGAVSLHPDLQVDIVELAPGVIKAAEWFAHINEEVLRQPGVTLRLDDARNHLLFGRHSYDVITADIIQPTHAGAGLLYSREYFELARRALNPGGVMVQWVGLRSAVHYRLIARTFQQVFPETSVWVDGSLLIGSTGPLSMDSAGAKRQLPSALQRALSDAGLGDPAALMGQFTAGPDALRRYVGEGPTLTDDRPLLEYYLSLPDDRSPVDVGALKRSLIPDP